MLKKQSITNLIIMIVGNLSLALGISLFILPHGIINGGTSGISLIVEALFGIDPAIIIFVLCWFLFFVGLIVLGKDFALKTLLSTFLYPGFVALFKNVDYFVNLSREITNPLLATLAGAVLVGFGMGMVYRNGGSTGGVDVINLMFKKYFGIKLSISTFVIDTIIITIGLISLSLESALYGILCVLLTSYVIERITISGTSSYMAHIISDKALEINEYLNKVLERGTTLIKASGGISGNEKTVIEVVFNEKEYYDIKKNIYLIDENAFLSIYKTINTYGNGFEEFIARR